MAIEYCNSPINSLPAAADAITVTSNASADTYGSWVEISASAPENLFIAGIRVRGAASLRKFDVQIGKGAIGFETALATFTGISGATVGTQFCTAQMCRVLAGMPISGISSGDRISARIKFSVSGAVSWTVALEYLPNPIDGTLETTSQSLLGTGIFSQTTSPTPWADPASWVEIRSASGNAWILNHIAIGSNSGTGEVEVDIGTGSAGSETVITTMKTEISTSSSLGMPNTNPLPILLNNIASSTRVAFRARASVASLQSRVALGYYE